MQVKLRRKIVKNIIKTSDGCWLWARVTRKSGYAQITYLDKGKRKYTSPHRLAYILFRNRLDLLETPTMFVCHRCDNKHCVNPEHMFVGTWLDNAFDDALRNDKTDRKHQDKILSLYRQEHGIRKSADARKHFYKRIGRHG